jgi:hypothetical protein
MPFEIFVVPAIILFIVGLIQGFKKNLEDDL